MIKLQKAYEFSSEDMSRPGPDSNLPDWRGGLGMRRRARVFLTGFAVTLILVASTLSLGIKTVSAQDQGKDNTGTNPVNFSRDIRAYNDFSKLNTEGDGTQNVTTLEFRTPFAEGKWQWRLRARYNSTKADLNDDGDGDVDESGLGDSDMRFLTVVDLDMETKTAWAAGLEVLRTLICYGNPD